MKRHLFIYPLIAMVCAMFFQSCNDDETYADKRKRENKQINSFLTYGVQIASDDDNDYLLNVPGNIQVISEDAFHQNDSTTDVSKNEYVRFDRTGVYMQIISKGTGKKLADGEHLRILCRYTEFNIASDSIQSSNCTVKTSMNPDVMSVSNTSGTFMGNFLPGGVMYSTYNSSAVPPAWLIPLTYINLGRPNSDEAEFAHVRLIVPASQGQANASKNVYPCFYDITYEGGK